MSHRVLVLREGRIAAELSRAPGDGGIDPERIVAASVRDHPESAHSAPPAGEARTP
jgi:hypothetical protein